jgi:SAM-dependent methyltransferase
MAWNVPIPLPRLLDLLDVAKLSSAAHIVDLGCGTGELLRALVVQGRTGHGIDRDACVNQPASPQLRWTQADLADHPLTPSADLAICMGSTHAFGMGTAALTGAVDALLRTLKPGGWALIGEGYQLKPPHPDYAAMLGDPSGIERTHVQNVQTLDALGLHCQAAITATQAEWDAFEWAFYRRRGKVAWRDAWLTHGRDTMGFGAYLAQRP